MMRPSHSRRSSSNSQRNNNSDAWQPERPQESDWCNSFWSFAGRRPGSSDDPKAYYDGREGYDALMGRMKAGTKTMEDLRALFKERASMEEDYAKRLIRLSKSGFGAGETGHIERAIAQIKTEIEQSAKAHSDFAALLKVQDASVADFLTKREGARKQQQTAVEKAYKVKREQREIVNKAKAKYEKDAIDITGMHANAALSQGRDLDKVTAKMDKISQTVVVNERDYRRYVDVLKETTTQWNSQWKSYCDLCQDQEEERLAFVKARLWDWANALSTVAMTEDESSERSRMALEQCDPVTDLKIFIMSAGTGNDIPDPPPFVDYKLSEAPPKPSFKTARFTRSSTRGNAIRHSPSTVEDITRVFKTPPPGAEGTRQPQPRTGTSPKRQSQSQSGPPGGAIAATVAHNALSNSAFSSSASRPNFAPESQQASGLSNLESALGSTKLYDNPPSALNPQRPQMETANSGSSMFSPSRTGAASRSGRGTSIDQTNQTTPTKSGLISASAFKKRTPSNQPGDENAPPESVSPAPARYEGAGGEQEASPVKKPVEDEDDDPITRALAQLNTAPAPLRQSRSFGGPAPGAVPLPGMTSPGKQTQPLRRPPSRGEHLPHSQSTGGRPVSQSGLDQYGRRAPSRSTSPAPVASHMQPPSQPAQPGMAPYGQAFPGERSQSRPPSRQGSTVSVASNPNRFSAASPQQQQVRSPSPQPFAGIGARGSSPQPYQGHRAPSPKPFPGHRAPSPQPQQHFRAPSPGIHQQRAHSPGPAQYGQQQWQQQQQQPQHGMQPSHSSYGIASPAQGPPPSASPMAFATSPDPRGSPYAQHGTPNGYAQPGPPQGFAPPPQAASPYQAPPPAQQFQQQAPQHQGYAPAQSPFQQQPQQVPTNQYGVPHQPTPTPQPVVQQAPTPQPTQVTSPTGMFDEQGQPILFYVNAIYDYEPQGPEEFAFSKGDVIGVVATDPDGWWQGRKVGISTGGHIFPSNFTELLS
ncbi:hypothetical protein MNV49_006265 [Pseudohyphozyma bogoriensis]|nr:hypothetical protein MNV49_006265 [Pseudohyphozyma bogoriensis]